MELGAMELGALEGAGLPCRPRFAILRVFVELAGHGNRKVLADVYIGKRTGQERI